MPQHREKLVTMADQLKQMGRGEGRRTALTDVARAVLKQDLDADATMEMTGLPEDELQKFAQ